MSMPAAQIVYEIHSAVWDIDLVDTRRRGYRTAKGQLRPCFTFVFAPAASLALAFSLSADPLERQTIVTLLYAVMMQPADQLCGGIPNEVWLYESTASFASSLRRLCEDLGILLRPAHRASQAAHIYQHASTACCPRRPLSPLPAIAG